MNGCNAVTMILLKHSELFIEYDEILNGETVEFDFNNSLIAFFL